MFRASLRPSSGEQTACLPVLATVVVVPESRVVRCVHCAEDVALQAKSVSLLMTGIKQLPEHWFLTQH